MWTIRRGHLARAAAAVFVSALVWRPSLAQTGGAPIRLDYDATGSCPTRDTFIARVRARTGRFEPTLADPQATGYRVTLRSEDESTGRVESREPSGATIVQELHGTTCGEVADALALVVALAVDTRAADALAAAPPPIAPAPASPPREVPSDRPVAITPRASRWVISSTIGIGVTGRFVGPEAFLEGSLVPAAGDRGLSLLLDARLGASFSRSSAGDSSGGAVQFTRISALLDLCPLRLAAGRFVVSACARGEAGALTDSGGSLQATRPSLAGGALVMTRWMAWDRIFVQLEGGAVVPLLRDRFFLDGTVVYAVPPVDALGSVAVGARFR